MSGIGAHIRYLRKQRGWSQTDLGRAVCRAAGVVGEPVGRQEVSRWERGKRKPREWLPFIALALGVTVDELLAAEKAQEPTLPTLADYLPDDDPLAPLEGAHGRLGAGAIGDLRNRVHGLRLADDVMAGGDLIRPALRELRRAVKLYRQHTHTDAVGRELLVQIGELAQIAGWVASDAGQHDDAERIYRLGLSAAKQAGDSTLAGQIAGCLAYQWSNIGRASEGVVLARAALDEAGTDAPSKARALYWDRVAWAYTKANEPQEALRALGEAGEAFTQDAGPEEPSWLYWVSEGELRVMESRVYTELHRPLRAVPMLRDVLGEYDATHAREVALYSSWLAVALVDANEPEEAASTTERILRLTEDLPSDRTTTRLQVVLARLEAYEDVPEVADVLQQARTA